MVQGRRVKRPEWTWTFYNNWRKRSPSAMNYNFEGCGWFKVGEAWCRQDDDGHRLVVHENGRVVVLNGVFGWN